MIVSNKNTKHLGSKDGCQFCLAFCFCATCSYRNHIYHIDIGYSFFFCEPIARIRDCTQTIELYVDLLLTNINITTSLQLYQKLWNLILVLCDDQLRSAFTIFMQTIFCLYLIISCFRKAWILNAMLPRSGKVQNLYHWTKHMVSSDNSYCIHKFKAAREVLNPGVYEMFMVRLFC